MSFHIARIITVPSDDDATVEDKYQAVCIREDCPWASDLWATEDGAEEAKRWHEDHPGTGEVPQIEIEEK